MKTFLLLFAACALVVQGSQTPLRKGDSAARIKEMLGEPNGFMETSGFAVYYYDRGEVRTRHGEVTHIYLLSEDEYAAQVQREKEQAEKRHIEGEALLARIVEKGGVEHLSGREQLAYWESFRESYPEVDVRIFVAEARERAQTERREEEEAQRLARLEQRVLQAELRAAQAEEKAAEAQRVAAQRQNRIRVQYPYRPFYSGSYLSARRRSFVCRTTPTIRLKKRTIDTSRSTPQLTRNTTLVNFQSP